VLVGQRVGGFVDRRLQRGLVAGLHCLLERIRDRTEKRPRISGGVAHRALVGAPLEFARGAPLAIERAGVDFGLAFGPRDRGQTGALGLDIER
jgi:hypothetical protein